MQKCLKSNEKFMNDTIHESMTMEDSEEFEEAQQLKRELIETSAIVPSQFSGIWLDTPETEDVITQTERVIQKLSTRILNRVKSWSDLLKFGQAVVDGILIPPSYLGLFDVLVDRSIAMTKERLTQLREINTFLLTQDGEDGTDSERAFLSVFGPQDLIEFICQQMSATDGFVTFWSTQSPDRCWNQILPTIGGMYGQRWLHKNGFYTSSFKMTPHPNYASQWFDVAPNLKPVFEANDIIFATFSDTIYGRNVLLETVLNLCKRYRSDWASDKDDRW